MDFIKNATSAQGNKAEGASQTTQNQTSQTQKPAGQTDDYVDKATDFGLDKSGYGGKVSDDMREKATDAGRGAYEKLTGNKVDSKYSN